MEEKYVAGIKAGLALAAITCLFSIVSLILIIVEYGSGNAIASVMLVIVRSLECLSFIALSAVAGVLSLRAARGMLQTRDEIIKVTAVAGGSFAVLYAVAGVIIAFIKPFFVPSAAGDQYPQYPWLDQFGSGFLGGLTNAFCSLVCCTPFALVVAIAVAVIAGLVYMAVVEKSAV